MERSRSTDLATLIAVIAVIAALYLGRAVLMPLALALLVTFLLAPLVSRLERWKLGRVPAVVAVCVLLGGVAFGVGWVMTHEVSALADDYAAYRTNVRAKFRDLRGPLGSLSGASQEISEITEAIQPGSGESAPKVEVVEPPRLLGTLRDLLAQILEPIGTAGLVAILALFMLLEREELRDRMIWLTGAADLSLTTHGLDDAMERVSRYMSTQSLIAGIHGVAVGAGLFAIGVPGAILWGALAAMLRFLPYFGPWMAAVPPIVLAAAAFPAWTPVLLTIGLLVTLELVTNNVLEPKLYGASVGLSPFGVIFSAVFWAWLWGVPGLLLATPLTVCLVVAGRYLRSLEVLTVLLGDEPALPPDVRLYQRLLSLDFAETESILKECARGSSLEALSDGIVMPVLRRLAEDDQRDAVPDERSAKMRARLDELLSELAGSANGSTVEKEGELHVLFVPALDENDAIASRWLAHVVSPHGVKATVGSAEQLASEVVQHVVGIAPDVVCISALSARAVFQSRLILKRLVEAAFDRPIIVGIWAAPARELEKYTARNAGEEALCIASVVQLEAALASHRARRGPLRSLS